ncbi:MAG TPA: glycosyltransferase family 2 protein [Verrucomicrobiae bacterium]|nr:glycosyltransferase family 2 protein [Verrucomicrobiae bacterium]
MKTQPEISIVTPSFRGERWLPLCIASVADQQISREHIVQDAGSDDGTLDWLPTDTRVRAFVEKDQGMYDAVNRGFRRATGDLLAYLNCDEQYLPHALKRVTGFFKQHPEVDILFGDCLVVDAKGEYICERRSLTPRLIHTWTASNLSFLTAATFVRRRVLEERQLWFNEVFRDAGDQDWALRVVRAGIRTAVLPEFLSVFTETGANMNLGANASRERRLFHATAPWWARLFAPLALAHHRVRRWRAGHYRSTPHDYAIYTRDSLQVRQRFQVTHPTFRWMRPAAATAD